MARDEVGLWFALIPRGNLKLTFIVPPARAPTLGLRVGLSRQKVPLLAEHFLALS